ncbi:hypothetical protein PS6_006750 [Mucor atramentarius]
MEPNVSQQAYTSMMKFTIDGRPYLKDIHDLFAALIVQIPLDTHRYLFRNYYNTFSSEDAIQALGNLRFSHTVRIPDPNDSSRLQRTTTTTTFNMAREMAKSLCQQFQNCRLMENAVDPQNRTFRDKGIWHLTPKGLCVLQDFCVRTEVNMTALRKHFSHMEAIHLVRLDRNPDDDQLILNRACVSVIFRVMMTCLPLDGELTSSGNASSMSVSSRQQSTSSTPPSSTSSSVSSATSSSTPSLSAPFAMSSTVSSSDSRVHMLGNYLLTLSKSGRTTAQLKTAKTMRTVFSSQMCCDWLLDYNTVSCREEAEAIAQEFIKYNWIEFQDPKHHSLPLKSSKVSMFVVTDKGKQIVSEPVKQPNSPSTSQQLSDRSKITTSSNIVRSRSNTITKEDEETSEEEKTTLREILSQDPDSLLITQQSTTTTDDIEDASTHSGNSTSSRPPSIAVDHSSHSTVDPKESNSARLKIILENAKLRSPFKDFLRANFCEENLDFWIDYNTLRRKCRNQSPALPSQNQKDLLEDAYDIWSTYLAPGSSCELNVEHSLCQEMARIVHSVVTVIPAYPGQGKPTIVITASSASQSLRMMLKLFDRVNEHICRLMASDSVPKFVKTEKYRKIIDSIERSERKKQKELEELTDSLRKMDSTDDSYQTNIETS